MRKTLATLAAVTISACFIMAGIGSLYSQTFTNPVTIMYLTSSTGQPIGVSPQNPLPVTGGGGGGGLSVVDQSAWTQGTSPFTPNGGVFNDTATLSSGQEGTARLTTKRAQIVDVDTAGNALYTAITSSVPAGTNLIGKVGIDQTTPGTTNGVQVNAALPAGTNIIGSTSNDPCASAQKTNLPISFQTTSITQQIALSGSTKIYVCSLSLIASVATVFSITGGTGTNCGTPAALIGTTSATHGLSLAANGGLTLGNGAGTVAVTGAGSELCLVQSGAGDLVGNLTYVQQ